MAIRAERVEVVAVQSHYAHLFCGCWRSTFRTKAGARKTNFVGQALLLLGSTALFTPTSASAQIYVLVNDDGRSILIAGDKSRAPEVLIANEIRLKGGTGWRMQFATAEKLCWARRAVSGIRQPTKWVVKTAVTKQEAEKAARVAADVLSAQPNHGGSTWEGSGCNTTSHPFRNLKPSELETLASEPVRERDALGKTVDATRGIVRDKFISRCDSTLPMVSAKRLDEELSLPANLRTAHAALTLKGRTGLPPCISWDRFKDRNVGGIRN